MPSLYKRGDTYYVAFHDATRRPNRKHVSLRVSGYRAARAKAARLTAEYEAGLFCPWTPPAKKDPASLGEAIQAFLKTRANLSKQSIQKYHSVLGQLRKHVGPGCALENITSSCIQNFLDSGKRAPITKKTYSTTLSPFFNWAITQGWIDSNPVTAVRLPPVAQTFPKALSIDQLRQLERTILEYDKAIALRSSSSCLWMIDAIWLTFFLGLRLGELCSLKWEDVDLERQSILIGGRGCFKTKNNKSRALPLPMPCQKLLSDLSGASEWVLSYENGGNLKPLYVSRRFKKFARMAGLGEHFSFHSLRHSCCTFLITSGANIEAVRRFMGHSSIAVTQRYVHLCHDDIRYSVERAHSRIDLNINDRLNCTQP